MFQEGRTNTHDDKCEGWPSITWDKIVQYILALLKDDHRLAIIDAWCEMAAHFSHKAGEATHSFIEFVSFQIKSSSTDYISQFKVTLYYYQHQESTENY